MSEESEIAKFYKGQVIFITGATGLLGKVLIWKLLHSCPQVDTIYVLVRPKRGKSIESRVDDMLKTPIFKEFWEGNQKMLRKVIGIPGDVANENLDLSSESRETLIENVSIVFHVAATLKLDANLKDAVNMNTEGTLRLLQLSKDMKKLAAFIHTSTAFCHCDVQKMEERVYPPPTDPRNVMNLVRWMDRDVVDFITDKIIQPHPNTYTYSKRLAEKIVAEFYPELPVAIARPSIVVPAWKEPMPGWVDNLNGPVGIMIGAGKGIIRTMLCNPDYNAEVIPVDVAINGLLAFAWKVASTKPDQKPSEIPVCNLTQNDLKPMTWGQIVETGKQLTYNYPFEMTLWYPGGNIRSNQFVHNMLAFLFHWIPAYFIDFVMLVIGQKRFMVRIQQRIHDGLRVLQYFTTHQWTFLNTKLLQLRSSMSAIDRKIFNLDLELIDPKLYMKDCILGARQYCMKEDLSTIPRCRKHMKVLYVVDRATVTLFYLLLMWLVLRLMQSSLYLISDNTDHSKPLNW